MIIDKLLVTYSEAAATFIKSPKWRECLINVQGANKDYASEEEKERKRPKCVKKHRTPMRKLIKSMPGQSEEINT